MLNKKTAQEIRKRTMTEDKLKRLGLDPEEMLNTLATTTASHSAAQDWLESEGHTSSRQLIARMQGKSLRAAPAAAPLPVGVQLSQEQLNARVNDLIERERYEEARDLLERASIDRPEQMVEALGRASRSAVAEFWAGVPFANR